MKRWGTVIMAVVLVSLPVLGLSQQAAPPPPAPPERPPGAEGKSDLGKMERSEDWQTRHEKMAAAIKAMDARLDEKVAAMNAAKGEQKIEAMAAVINELVAQRKEMKATFGPMHHGMKCPMMGQSGGMPPDCPMMKHHGVMPPDTPKKEGTP